jgi:tRNA modification GTPase
LRDAAACAGRALEVLETAAPVELAAAELGRGLAALGTITGESAGPELLDAIFSEFCIGK